MISDELYGRIMLFEARYYNKPTHVTMHPLTALELLNEHIVMAGSAVLYNIDMFNGVKILRSTDCPIGQLIVAFHEA